MIDDVLNGADLKPFLQGGKRRARLITMRDEGVLPRIAQRIHLYALRMDQAVALLSAGLIPSASSVNEMFIKNKVAELELLFFTGKKGLFGQNKIADSNSVLKKKRNE